MNGIKKGGGGRGKYKFVKKGGTSSRGDVKRNGGWYTFLHYATGLSQMNETVSKIDMKDLQ